MLNILTFDVEEWYEAFDLNLGESGAFNKESRVAIGVQKILDILRPRGIKATFFIVGKLAEKNGDIVRMIDEEGHEIATHGYYHAPISLQTPDEFKKDLLLSIKVLSDITGKSILGYRAPGYSLIKGNLWAIDIIKNCGLKYDSSIYPVSLRLFTRGGISGYPQEPFIIKNKLKEFPLATLSLFGFKFPIATTTYFRIFPYAVTKWAINKLNKKGITANINLHCWEFDAGQPKISLPFPQNIKHYYNLSRTDERFRKLIEDFKFMSCKEAISQNVDFKQ